MKEQAKDFEMEALTKGLEVEEEIILDEDFESLIEFATRRC